VEIIAPLYTHLDKDDKPCGVLVNRGWAPWDLHNLGNDKIADFTKVEGVLYQGDPKTRDSKKNTPILQELFSTHPEEIALLTNLPNEKEASLFMLKSLDFDEANRTHMPDVQSPTELTKFVIPPERHEAYEKLWNSMVYFGVVANTVMWLYL